CPRRTCRHSRSPRGSPRAGDRDCASPSCCVSSPAARPVLARAVIRRYCTTNEWRVAMQAVKTADVEAYSFANHREGDITFQRLLQGDPDAPDNFEWSIV